MWATGVLLLGDDKDGLESSSKRLEFLRAMMLQHPDDVSLYHPSYRTHLKTVVQRELVVKELVLRLILAGKHKEALEELEL